ncbi:hypothetical protein R3P38DRAFT_1230425 [Favolaschia claudopus]|uniref:Zn(2)-C6 fungal-type domain-containing protein n=1 Tax=Favolaschia claudopus TaxID=2862362 RepID=A0AAW0B1Y4_9AGAR
MDTPQDKQSSSPPQVRSRITVVCAECKRLKLKCDRRTPCGSCVKRDTTVRCIYSPAAAEKVDLHSLNNRLIHIEQWMQQLGAEGPPLLSTNNPPLPLSAPAQMHQQQLLLPQVLLPPAGPPPPTTALTMPLPLLHSTFLAPLGVSMPSFPPSANPTSKLQRTSKPLPPLAPPSPALLRLLPSAHRLPTRLAAAHAALASCGAAPFPFPWFEARVYAFLSALASPSSSSSSSSSSFPSSSAAISTSSSTANSAATAKALAKAQRRQQKQAQRERAMAIFSGGNPANGLPALPPGFLPSSQSSSHNPSSSSHNQSQPQSSSTYTSPLAHQSSFPTDPGSVLAQYTAHPDLPPIHALAVGDEESDSFEQRESGRGREGREGMYGNEEVDELVDDEDAAVGGGGGGGVNVNVNANAKKSRAKSRKTTAAASAPSQGQALGQGQPRRRRTAKGDGRLAFFALLCAVLGVSSREGDNSGNNGDGAREGEDGEEYDLAEVAMGAVDVYFAAGGVEEGVEVSCEGSFSSANFPSTQANFSGYADGEGESGVEGESGEGGEGNGNGAGNEGEEEGDPDLDALLAMWVVGVRMILRGAGAEEVYVHFAKTVARARVVGLDVDVEDDSPSSSSFAPPFSSSSAHPLATSSTPTALTTTTPWPPIKTEEDGGGGTWQLKKEEYKMSLKGMRRRTWWGVVAGDMLASDALGVEGHVGRGCTRDEGFVGEVGGLGFA